MRGEAASGQDWRDAAAYAPLLKADRSLFAWEWLRRTSDYRAAAGAALRGASADCRADSKAAAFGLVAFERPELPVPLARPLWRSDTHPFVLRVERGSDSRAEDKFDLDRMRDVATLVADQHREHLLLSDGLRAVRLDGPLAAFSAGRACLRYVLEGLVAAEPGLLTLRRFLALCRTGRFAHSLHRRECRARRWIFVLRAWDALAADANQREIAEALFSRSVTGPRWRSREPSVRSQVQRLVHGARWMAGGGYRWFLGPPSNSVGDALVR
jgi:hypothetical protein